jgi:hypothetical protein
MHLLSLCHFRRLRLYQTVGTSTLTKLGPMNGTLCFGNGVDKGGSRLAPFGEWLVTNTVGSPNLVAHHDVWEQSGENGSESGSIWGIKAAPKLP